MNTFHTEIKSSQGSFVVSDFREKDTNEITTTISHGTVAAIPEKEKEAEENK
ncbi:MAG: hypothetical protein HRF40_10050 [Nitrososphaera sp.]|jgi:hypothetical protein